MAEQPKSVIAEAYLVIEPQWARLHEALTIVTKRVIANALRTDYAIAPEWENYPEIGMDDWTRIEKAVKEESEGRYGVVDEAYHAAYEFLEGRTTDEAVP